MDKMLHTKAQVTKSSEDGIVEAVVASTEVLDRQGDVIDQDGWDIKNFQKNPVILWGHNVQEERPPIGKAEKVWFEGEGKRRKLMFTAKFDMEDSFAAEIFRKIKEKFINMVSVGFLPTEWEKLDKNDPFGGNKFLQQELLEISFVPVPANPQAAVQIRSMGVEPIEEDKLFSQVEDMETEDMKGVIPFKATETLPEASEWDGPGEVSKASIQDLKIMCAWFDAEAPDVKSSYKLPHHRVEDHSVVWRGVAGSMALLLGANGGVKIPDEDKKGVYNHLVKHYKQFDKEAPEYRHVEEQILKGLENEVGALILDREDRYAVKLIKKLLRLQKENTRHERKQNNGIEQIADALTLVDKSLSQAFKLGEGGGK